jgi:heme-degrading monooxygenase HmoA
MFSVIFEVHPQPERFDEYLALAAHLRPILEKIDGFLDNERFRSLRRPGWLLSHSTWRDEKSVVRWRTEGEHHQVQARGRGGIFCDYHLRVGDIGFDSHPPVGGAVHPQRFDETDTGAAKFVSLTELQPEPGGDFAQQPERLPAALGLALPQDDVVDWDLFGSITTEGKFALLVSWRSEEAASRWTPAASMPVKSLRHRRVRIVRDYGMYDRREAPQYYPPATPPR